MSVLGLGLDLVDVGSFARQLDLAGSSFATETFTTSEFDHARRDDEPGSVGFARHLAARFAAKEAFIKAWSMARMGSRPAMSEVRWLDLEIHTDAWGRPSLGVAGQTAVRMSETLGTVGVAVSLTHEDTMAAAVVVISSAERPADDQATGPIAVGAARGNTR